MNPNKLYNCYAYVKEELNKVNKFIPDTIDIYESFKDGDIYKYLNNYKEISPDDAKENDVILWNLKHIGILKKVDGFMEVHHYSYELKKVIKEDYTRNVKKNTKIFRIT